MTFPYLQTATIQIGRISATVANAALSLDRNKLVSWMDMLSNCQQEFVKRLVVATARSVSRSLQNYWPSNVEGGNDPCEQNVVLHLGHQLLRQRFSVFSEAHCNGGGRIDLVALSPEQSWYMAFEAKRLLSNKPTESLTLILNDVKRLRKFRLNRPQKWLGPKRGQVVENCKTGIGIVGGLVWSDEKSSSLFDFWQSTSIADISSRYHSFYRELEKLEARRIEPISAWREEGGSYYLLSAVIECGQNR